jgi:hypothetical protein
VLGLLCAGAIVVVTIQQGQTQEVTRHYWYVREEVRMLERDVGGQKVIIPFQTKPTEPELRQEKVPVTPTSREVMILWFYGGIAVLLGIFLLTCLVVLIWAWKRKEEPPDWAKTWTNNLVSGFLGAFLGFIGAQTLPDPARNAGLSPPPPPTVSKP